MALEVLQMPQNELVRGRQTCGNSQHKKHKNAEHTARKKRSNGKDRTYLDKRSNRLPFISGEYKPKQTRSQRAKARLKTKRTLIRLAKDLNNNKLAEKFSRCSSVRAFLTCGQHEHKKITNYHCQERLCPYCAEKRSRDLFRKYYPIVKSFIEKHRVEPVHLILTQAQRKDETAKQSRQRIMTAFRKLVRSDRKNSFWNEYFLGGIWSLEIKLAKDKDGVYHTHLHILAFRKKQFPIKTGNNPFRDEWRSVGGGENFCLSQIKGLDRGLREILKYISKPLDIELFTKENLRDFIEMKKLPFVSAFGEFRKFAIKFEPEPEPEAETDSIDYGELIEGSPCPDCSQPLFQLRLMDDEYIKYLERMDLMKANAPPG
jgi:plasmid rolling circle replication initiator protein Rep